ncbi:MAG: flagellar hook-associated protein FlgK [Bacillota bacterium]
MRSTFFGLETGRRALDAQRRALEVTSHNIANATTEGYSRQRVKFAATSPYTLPGINQPSGALQLGTGVKIEEIRRMRDYFLDGQVRRESTSLGLWEKTRDLLSQVEVIFNEPSESGLRSVLERFWASWQDLGNNPESLSVRATVVKRGQAVADTFRHLWNQLTELQASLDREIAAQVSVINSLGAEIASLNMQIAGVSGSGQQANDLMDRRDRLLGELSRMTEVNVIQGPSDTITVFIAGGNLVSGNASNTLETRDGPGGLKIYWKGLDVVFSPRNGEVSAVLQVRDSTIPGFKDHLNKMAIALRDRVNNLHREGRGLDGSTGLDFFVPTAGASGIVLTSGILGDYNKIAASLSGSVGDGSNALRIAQVSQEALLDRTTPGDFYRSLVAELGVKSQEASRMSQNQRVLVNHLNDRRDSIQGVSLDEEMTELIRYQHAYAAAARLITALDEMIATIVNRLGLVGR